MILWLVLPSQLLYFVLQVVLCCIFLMLLLFLHFVWKWWFCGCVCLYNYFVSFSKWCFAITFWCCHLFNLFESDALVVGFVCTGTLLCSPSGAMVYLSDVVSSFSLKVKLLSLVLSAQLLCFVLQMVLCCIFLMLLFLHLVWKWWFCVSFCLHYCFISF